MNKVEDAEMLLKNAIGQDFDHVFPLYIMDNTASSDSEQAAKIEAQTLWASCVLTWYYAMVSIASVDWSVSSQ